MNCGLHCSRPCRCRRSDPRRLSPAFLIQTTWRAAMCCYRLLLALIVSLGLAGSASAADPLGRYPVDPTQISVAGISSGAFMANQLHVAHSADIMGIGVVAGGPFGCAVADTNDTGVVALISIATGACMQAPNLLHPAEAYAERIRVFAAQGWI